MEFLVCFEHSGGISGEPTHRAKKVLEGVHLNGNGNGPSEQFRVDLAQSLASQITFSLLPEQAENMILRVFENSHLEDREKLEVASQLLDESFPEEFANLVRSNLASRSMEQAEQNQQPTRSFFG